MDENPNTRNNRPARAGDRDAMGPADGGRPQFASSLPTLRIVGKDGPGVCRT